MLFNSIDFLIFLPVVAALYFLLPNKVKNIWLLLTSYFFYMCWNVRYALLILASTAATYACALLLERTKRSASGETTRKWIIAACLVFNLGILFCFKYLNFTLSLLTRAIAGIHIELNAPVFDLVLPVGISFYTFQAIGYTLDVYRDEIPAERNFLRYALFVSFFPQLVAGPIERSGNLLRQLEVPRKFSFEDAREGFFLVLWGFFLKIVLADRIAIFVDTVYGDYAAYGGFYLLAATALFAVQIYCDFSGYSTIAMGAARILGIELMENFDAPYLSASVAGFWRSWHISLTTWFRDYLYIPLGGSRRGTLRKYVNKMTVFLVSGLWHGASLSFVVWGGLNGAYQIAGEMLQPLRDKAVRLLRLNRDSFAHKLLCAAGTFLLVDFSWIFFRAGSIMQALDIIKSMLGTWNPWILFDGSLYRCGVRDKSFRVMLAGILLLFCADLAKRRGIQVRKILIAQDCWFRCVFVALSIAAIALFGVWGPSFDKASFIYFQF